MKHPVDSLPFQNPFTCPLYLVSGFMFRDFHDEQMHPDLLFSMQDDLPFLQRMLNLISGLFEYFSTDRRFNRLARLDFPTYAVP